MQHDRTASLTLKQRASSTAAAMLIAITSLPAIAAEHAKSSAGARATATQPRGESVVRVRASAQLGAGIQNPIGEDLGKFTDLLIDLSKGEVRYGIVEFGGALGVGSKLFAFPFKSFAASPQSDKLVLNIDRDKLKTAPGFARNGATDWSKYESTLDRYFGVNQPASTNASRNLHLATQIIGTSNVIDKNGAKVGTVTDMVITRGDGRIQYLVLSLDRGVDAERRMLPLPLTAFYFGQSGGAPVLDIPMQRLDARYAYDDARWPDINDPAYQQKLGGYLGHVTQSNPSPTPPNSNSATPGRTGS